MTWPTNLNMYISALLFILGAYIVALYLGLIVWTFRDIRARSRDVLAQIMATLLVALFTLPGLLVYLLLRPHTTLAEEYEHALTEEAVLQELERQRTCPGCQRRVEPDFIICPYCHEQLRLRCTGCGRLLELNWDVCPYCGLYKEVGEEAATEETHPVPEVLTEENAEPVVDVLATSPAKDLFSTEPVESGQVGFAEGEEGDVLNEPGGKS